MEAFEIDLWSKRIRLIFWMFGVLAGGLPAYTSRYFINGDAMTYIEMGKR